MILVFLVVHNEKTKKRDYDYQTISVLQIFFGLYAKKKKKKKKTTLMLGRGPGDKSDFRRSEKVHFSLSRYQTINISVHGPFLLLSATTIKNSVSKTTFNKFGGVCFCATKLVQIEKPGNSSENSRESHPATSRV